MFVVTGSPLLPFVDAFKAALKADAALMAVIEGVFGHLKETARQAYPYIVLGRRTKAGDEGPMGLAGGRFTMQLDGWSNHQGASEMHVMLGHVFRVMERRALVVSGFDLIRGSLTCEYEDVFDEPDPDTPTRTLYHGVQRWACEIHETS